MGVAGDWKPTPGHGAQDAAEAVDAQLEQILKDATGPVNWRTLPAGQAREQWTTLREWVDWFRLRFGYDHRVVPPCWYRHDALVDVLSALHDHWRCAYDPLNTPTAASEWHLTLIPLESRLREWASRTGCTPAEHRPDVLAAYPDDTDQWDQHVDADITRRADREQQRQGPETGHR